jgi:Heterokaryon incompatibility protein (HET)
MRKIYQNAKTVLIWLGPDTQEHQAQVAIESILTISDFLCQKLGVSVSDLSSIDNVYQKAVFKNRDCLPLPNECEFSTDAMWKSLVWFYSHSYLTRVWAIQEISANKERWLHCGSEKIEWDRVDLVAAYIIMEPAFSKSFGFSDTHCWWATTVTEIIRQPKDWLFMLYLASNYSCMDTRDAIYGLRGLMEFSDGAGLLHPDYSKSIVEVYRDSVEAAFVNFQNTNVLLYTTGNENPSWIPRWDRPMLFRNPFRFGKALPWKPAGETKPLWSIDKKLNVLSLSGFVVDLLKFVESYNESFFGNAMIKSDEGKNVLEKFWQRILRTVENSQSQIPFSTSILTAVAISFSFGLDEKTNPADEHHLLHSFVAHLKTTLDKETYNKYIPPDLTKELKDADGHAFGKPVWDFKYPHSSFFITEDGFIGCSISTARPGDMVCVALGSTYPLIMRPDDDHFLIRGYAYVHGIMHGEQRNSEEQVFKIR